jgi:tRNA pseudouridine13 synthase
LFRAEFEDFKVDEILGFDFSGEGEHLCLHIEKQGENTRWVAKLLAEYFEVDEMAIGYCGLKDRRAVTRQWFSVHLPNTPDIRLPVQSEYQVLESYRHNKKLRRGMHQANSFVIRLREVQGDREAVDGRLQQILEQGVPNYFGEQRFGIDGGNLPEADSLLRTQYGADRIKDSGKKRGRGKRGSPRGGIYMSAARSYLFNLVLAERVKQGNWSRLLEAAVDKGTVEGGTLESKSATGPMWGRGRSNVPEAVREFEQLVLSDWQDWTNALEFSGLQQERRSLVLNPEGFSWQWLPSAKDSETYLELSFSLSSG